MSPAISFENVSKTYAAGKRRVSALADVTLDVEHGDVFGIVGYSGAGKSTLLRTINALERPTSGRVVVDGLEVSSLRGRQLHRVRQRIGMIFQQFNLLQSRTVYKNVAYPLEVAGASRGQIVDRVEELLDFVGLTDKAFDYPSRLSGGQKQRVGIARALANRPDILLSDEATSALDPQTTAEVLELLQRVNREYGVTIALVTHEMEVIREIANKVAVMQGGEVVETGGVYDIFAHPRHATTERFVSSVLHHVPDAAALERIRRVHRGRIVQIHVENRESNDPFLSRIARHHDVDLETPLPKIGDALLETLQMITVSFILAGIIGVLLGIVLYATRPGNVLENRWVFGALSTVINVIRPIPFIIVIVALTPVTRAVIGTSIGTGAAIFALTIVASISIARIAESNLVAVDPGTVEAGAAMGASPVRVLFTIVIPESLGPLTLGLTYIFVALVDATAVAGLVGGGGLGNLAITYGYQRFDWFVMAVVIVVLIVLVQLAQLLGSRLSRRAMHQS